MAEFSARNLAKAGYEQSPLEDGTLSKWQVVHFNISQLTLDAVKPFGLGNKEALRCKNMWTLGLALWMFDRDRAPIVDWLKAKFAKAPELAEANIAALNAGHAYGETVEMGAPFKQHHIAPAPAEPGLYRTVTGAEALALGLVAGCQLAGLKMFFGGYRSRRPRRSCTISRGSRNSGSRLSRRRMRSPRSARRSALLTPVSLASLPRPGRDSAEDRGDGPRGHDRTALVIINSQRGGPSTGLPTKTEQSDLYQAVYGRNADSPIPVIAARSPADAFDCAIEACRIATRYMTPAILLTDGYIANAAEPWKVPDMAGYTPFPVKFFDTPPAEGEGVMPYARGDGLARPWIKPGTPGLEHRIGGIEKQPGTGNIDYSPQAHQEMTDTRAAKVLGVANSIPDQEVCIGRQGAELAVVGWGSTFGPIHQAVRRAIADGKDVAHVHIRHIWPMPKNMSVLLKGFEHILVPEMNMAS